MRSKTVELFNPLMPSYILPLLEFSPLIWPHAPSSCILHQPPYPNPSTPPDPVLGLGSRCAAPPPSCTAPFPCAMSSPSYFAPVPLHHAPCPPSPDGASLTHRVPPHHRPPTPYPFPCAASPSLASSPRPHAPSMICPSLHPPPDPPLRCAPCATPCSAAPQVMENK